jgi:hypothetical protein
LGEQLADHGRDAAEEVRTEAVFEARGRRSLRRDPGGKSIRVHRIDLGVPDDVDRFRGEFLKIALPRARV